MNVANRTVRALEYDIAKVRRDALYAEVKRTADILSAFPRTGAMSLPTDEVRLSPEYRAARAASDRAFAELRAFNVRFVKVFAAEIRAERRNRFASK